MAVPKVFVSSTCYDLKYIRENIRYFIKRLGYDPILSEDGSVFFNPALHTHDACITEIPNTQIFVLIIGGRHGGKFKETEDSITNTEFREAVRLKIPVFTLVDHAVYNDHHVYTKNRGNKKVKLGNIKFPSVDSTKIFDFIDEVRGSSTNNAIVPFRDFGEVEAYLTQQWAAMMFDFLANRSGELRVADTLASLAEMNNRIEMLSKQILVSVGTDEAKVDAALYEELMSFEAMRDISYWKLRPSPYHVLISNTYNDCISSLSVTPQIDSTDGGSYIGQNFRISKSRFEKNAESYLELRDRLLEILKSHNVSPEAYLERWRKERGLGNQMLLEDRNS